MKTIKTRTATIQETVALTCDRCGLTVTRENDDDVLEWQEFMAWRAPCGYGSIFGDGALIEVDLCQKCVQEVLGDYVRVVDWQW